MRSRGTITAAAAAASALALSGAQAVTAPVAATSAQPEAKVAALFASAEPR